jgi:uncharacterized protein (DUF2267 family)
MTVPTDVVSGSEQVRDWLLALKDRAMLGSTDQSYAMLRAVLREAWRDAVTSTCPDPAPR